jgi:hypothetical protein
MMVRDEDELGEYEWYSVDIMGLKKRAREGGEREREDEYGWKEGTGRVSVTV